MASPAAGLLHSTLPLVSRVLDLQPGGAAACPPLPDDAMQPKERRHGGKSPDRLQVLAEA